MGRLTKAQAFIVAIVALVLVAEIVTVALLMGHNGTMIAGAVGVFSAIAGAALGVRIVKKAEGEG